MKKILLPLFFGLTVFACTEPVQEQTPEHNKAFAAMLDSFYEDGLKLSPLGATAAGDSRYNDLLPAEFTDSYREKLRAYYNDYTTRLAAYDRSTLSEDDQLSFDDLNDQLSVSIEGLAYHDNYFPFNQFYALPLSLGQMGSGEGMQPFNSVKDYEDWIKRATAFSVWADSAIIYFKKGIDSGFVLPKSLVVKMIPQMQSMEVADVKTSLFYGPVNKIPKTFSDSDRQRLTDAYAKLISEQIIPAYKRLGDFLKNEYLPKTRLSSGVGALPGGDKYYAYEVKLNTTTAKSPEEIYQTGLKEVARIRGLMDSVKKSTAFAGDIPAFFEFMRTDKRFMPYKTPKEVLDAFEAIHQRMEPNLAKMFNHTPKTGFEIRQTEAFRAASASAEYTQGTADGSRPGIFYVPILDASKFNTTSGMESLFLHEAIPGHHYQISLQQEDTLLPKFRRFGGHNAYVEGWALYCESLGKELGLYTDPYQYMGALGDEMHRAVRLVVDVAIHTKGMTREEAIKYMMDNEAISEQGATAEIERYMAIPGQALGYKIGALKIRELRTKYENDLGKKFNLAAFHDEILKDGSLPLGVLEAKMDHWEEKQKEAD
ncbi:MAG TPA: DUF885 domain-containing protein [Panacibacter sp.]|nr:DUF885 domain-containing protein [Panacibacter sp.]HNP44634.1 DUF885 domain-containing protein [Panacibacter sp.]